VHNVTDFFYIYDIKFLLILSASV